jgi:hypothetical protein
VCRPAVEARVCSAGASPSSSLHMEPISLTDRVPISDMSRQLQEMQRRVQELEGQLVRVSQQTRAVTRPNLNVAPAPKVSPVSQVGYSEGPIEQGLAYLQNRAVSIARSMGMEPSASITPTPGVLGSASRNVRLSNSTPLAETPKGNTRLNRGNLRTGSGNIALSALSAGGAPPQPTAPLTQVPPEPIEPLPVAAGSGGEPLVLPSSEPGPGPVQSVALSPPAATATFNRPLWTPQGAVAFPGSLAPVSLQNRGWEASLPASPGIPSVSPASLPEASPVWSPPSYGAPATTPLQTAPLNPWTPWTPPDRAPSVYEPFGGFASDTESEDLY